MFSIIFTYIYINDKTRYPNCNKIISVIEEKPVMIYDIYFNINIYNIIDIETRNYIYKS